MPQPHTLDGSTIPLALEQLNKHKDDGDQSAASDYSSYTAMSNSWRPTNSNAIPTEQEIQDALDTLETTDAGGYSANVRATRDQLLAEADCLAIRHRDQVDNSETTTLTGAQYTELLNYKKDLRNLPANIVAGPAGTYGTFIAPIYPTKPTFM